jgi:hypothetical protein
MGKCTTLNMTSTNVEEITAKIDEMITAHNDIRTVLKGSYMISSPGLAIGTTPENVSNVAFSYTVNGIQYSKAAVAAGVAPGNDVIPVDTYGAVALDIDSAGTVTIAEATANATGYATSALALAGIPDLGANKARMGTVSVMRTGGGFTFGTTALSDATTTEVYTDASTAFNAIGAAVTAM